MASGVARRGGGAAVPPPGRGEACVISTRDPYRGETVKAVIVLRHDARKLTAQQIIDWAHDNMAAYKVPRIVEFTEALQSNGSGKGDVAGAAGAGKHGLGDRAFVCASPMRCEAIENRNEATAMGCNDHCKGCKRRLKHKVDIAHKLAASPCCWMGVLARCCCCNQGSLARAVRRVNTRVSSATSEFPQVNAVENTS